MKKLIDLYLKLFHFWLRFPEKIRFLLVGGYNTVISYALYTLFVWLTAGSEPQQALFLSYIISSINSFLTQKFYVFNTRGNYGKEYISCLLSWGVSYLFDALLLKGFLGLGLNPYFAQFLALALVTINNYVLLKYVAFQNHKKSGP